MGQQQEEFRSIPGYEGYYEVSNFGNVKSLEREILINGKYPSTVKERIFKLSLETRGYYVVHFNKNGKSKNMKIHVLVAMAFLGHVPDGTMKIVVDHIDNNPLNNHVSNLQLISNRENLSKDKKNGSSKYTGVLWSKATNKWRSEIRINGKKKHLGLFISEEEAHEAYQKALKIYHEGGDLSFMETKIPTSQYKGVSWDKRANKWVSYIKINGRQKYLGNFTSEEAAAEAYQKALKEKMNAE
jgi:hypothetical protein